MVHKTEPSSDDLGTIVLYQTEGGQTTLDVQLQDETVWLTQVQMVELFKRDKRTVSEHIRNIFKEGELNEAAVVRKSRTTAADGKSYLVALYNLDVIISVGYRVKSQRGTQFRIWATGILKDYLVRGYAHNQRRLAEKGVEEVRQVLSLLAATLENHHLVNDEGMAVLSLVRRYAMTWKLLLQYDEDTLALPGSAHRRSGVPFDHATVRRAIECMQNELAAKGESTDLFGRERGQSFSAILGAIQQTFGGRELYPSIEEKAAHLLYFVIKDHPFTDGNKRIGSFLFLLYLQINGLAGADGFDSKGLVALSLLTAASDPARKELMIRLIVNLLDENRGKEKTEIENG
jgi:prophage maintenance system killer protein